jgi:hypothetical protein
MVNGLQTQFSQEYQTQAFGTFNVRGQSAGMYKNAGSLSYVRFFGAGHEVPAYQVRNSSTLRQFLLTRFFQ